MSEEDKTYTHEQMRLVMRTAYDSGWDQCIATIREAGYRELAGKLDSLAYDARKAHEEAS